MKLFYICSLSLFIFGSGLISGCGSKSSANSATIPNALPIIQATIPANFKSSSTALFIAKKDLHALGQVHLLADANVTELKSRLFSPGPTDFQYRLKSIDSRLDQLETNAGDCVSAEAKEWSVPVGTSGISLSKMYFQCYTSATGPEVSDYKIYFGKKDGYWYLAELQINDNFESSDGESPTMGVLAKIADDSTTVEAYQISVEKVLGSYYATVTQILANKTTSVFEVSTASSATTSQVLSPGANMTGLGCGVQMKTDGINVYATGSFSQAPTCASSASPCVLASDITTAGTCTSINTLNTVAFTRAGLVTADVGSTAKSIIVSKTGMPTVNELKSGN